MTPFETLVLQDGAARAVLAPARGGMLTRWSVGDRALLYLDEGTLADPASNVRGGNPVLFPSPGPLAEGRFARASREGRMKQHGLARRRPFEVVAHDASSAVLRLAASDDMRDEFPWDFVLTIRYALTESSITMEQEITNHDAVSLPVAFGFHPYFAVARHEKARTSIPTRATRAWDNVGERTIELTGPIDLSEGEVDLHLEDHGERRARLVLPDGSRVVVTADEAFGRWVIWTLPERDFVCLEPWTAAADALNTGRDLIEIEPGESKSLTVSFSFVC